MASTRCASSMYELLNGCTFYKKFWAFGPLPPPPYTCKALHNLSLHENVILSVYAMLHILYSSCGILYLVWTPVNISGLISVVLWLLRWRGHEKKSGNILFKWGGANDFFKVLFIFSAVFIFEVVFIF